jgi:hypothetical protein
MGVEIAAMTSSNIYSLFIFYLLKTVGRCPTSPQGTSPLTHFAETIVSARIIFEFKRRRQIKVLIELFQKFTGVGTESQGLSAFRRFFGRNALLAVQETFHQGKKGF